ncbi:hypothetical protein KUR51_003943, partial [Escherichia coli]|nr:hypothetical protein [Escherichia coli]
GKSLGGNFFRIVQGKAGGRQLLYMLCYFAGLLSESVRVTLKVKGCLLAAIFANIGHGHLPVLVMVSGPL